MQTKHVQLPSKGLYYPAGHPLSGKATIQVKLLTAKQQDVLTDEGLAKTGETIKVLIDSIVVDKSIKQSTVLSGDRNAVLIRSRQYSLGAQYPFEWTCTSCGQKNDEKADLSKLKYKGEPSKPAVPLFDVVLPSGKMIKFKIFTSQDEQLVRKTQSKRKKAGLPPAAVTTRLAAAMIQLDGSTDQVAIQKFAEQMSAKDSKRFKDQIYRKTPDVDMRLHLTCKKCDAEKEVMLPLTAGFFRLG